MKTPKIIKGFVYHARTLPRENCFKYSIFSIIFDVKNISSLKKSVFSIDGWNLLSIHRRDHGYRDHRSLYSWAKDKLALVGMDEFSGDIFLQTFPRILGYGFNPVSFWYCYGKSSELHAIICEVNNTFGETHSYIITSKKSEANKVFHVSPFFDIKGQYDFFIQSPENININYKVENQLMLTTKMKGTEFEYSTNQLLSAFFSIPFQSLKIITMIHFQALKLYIKQTPFFSKPPAPKKEVTHEV